MQYKLIVCGGTFDHFHAGHAFFLRDALAAGNHVLIGITSDGYARAHKSQESQLQLYSLRKESVEKFFKEESALDRVTIASIDSIFYPKEWEKLPIEAIIVTEETKKGAMRINEDRGQKGLPLLAVVISSLKKDDTGEKIASTSIREGKINIDGVSYIQPSWFAKDLYLPEVEKQWFKKPFGELHKDNTFLSNENPQRIVTVGDVVTKDCNSISFKQKLSVIDFMIQRKDTFSAIQELGFSGAEKIFSVVNPASHITTNLVLSITQALDAFAATNQIVIVVDGEEDLAVIPLVLALPLGFCVVYGQPNQGVVRLSINDKTKETAYSLLQKFVFLR